MRGLLLIEVLAAGLLLAGLAPGDENGNLLENGGFEDVLLAPWSATGSVAAMVVKPWHPRAGARAFGMGNDGGSTDAWGSIVQDVHLSPSVAGRRACRFEVWVMPEGGYTGMMTLQLDFLGAAGESLYELHRSFVGMHKGAWERKMISAMVPCGTARIRVACLSERMQPGDGYSFIWFDDGSVTLP